MASTRELIDLSALAVSTFHNSLRSRQVLIHLR
jgi:hypothetical protein